MDNLEELVAAVAAAEGPCPCIRFPERCNSCLFCNADGEGHQKECENCRGTGRVPLLPAARVECAEVRVHLDFNRPDDKIPCVEAGCPGYILAPVDTVVCAVLDDLAQRFNCLPDTYRAPAYERWVSLVSLYRDTVMDIEAEGKTWREALLAAWLKAVDVKHE